MSVIIRLQNLPWSANAADIRQYFQGLSIPEGGVHIVGGEKGDAFISFSTDEDARQAMLSDGGCIKDVQIKLLLSSRNEMQKVIETARQQTMQITQVYMHQMQQPQLPLIGSLPPLTAKVLPQPQQQTRPNQLVTMLPRHHPIMDPTAVLMSQDKQQQLQQQSQQHMSPKATEIKDRDDKGGYKRERVRSKSREHRSRSSRSGGSNRRDRSRSRDRRRRDRSRGRDRSRDRYRNGGGNRNSSSRGSGGKPHTSRSPVGKTMDVNKGIPDQQPPNSRTWNGQYENMQPQAMTENHQPPLMNVGPPGNVGFNHFRTPPQPPIVPGLVTNSYQQHPQQMANSEWGDDERLPLQQQPYIPNNDFQGETYGGGSDDEDDRQAEFDNNYHRRFNDNNPTMRRGRPGQDFHDQQGFGTNRNPRFHKPQQSMAGGGQQNRGGHRQFDSFGGGGGPRFNHHQQHPRYGGGLDGNGRGGGRPSRFSSIQDGSGGKPSRFNAMQQQRGKDDDGGDDGSDFNDPKRGAAPARFNDRYRYDVRNSQTPRAEGLCVEVNNMTNHFSYGDVRKVFEGIHIDGSAIKIQKHRQGVAFVRFDNNHNKNLALRMNGNAYKGNNVVVKHLDDEAYERENTDDRPYPTTVAATVAPATTTAAVATASPNVVDLVDLVDDEEDNDGGKPSGAKRKKNDVRSDEDCNNLVVCDKNPSASEGGGNGGEGEVQQSQQQQPQQQQQQQQQEVPTKYLKLKQLPITVTEEDVLNEMEGGGEVRRVTFYPDGEFMGAALEFRSVDEAEATLKRFDCVLLGSTPVPVLRCTYKEYVQIKRKSGGGTRRFSGENTTGGGGRHFNHQQHHNPMSAQPPVQSNVVPTCSRSNCVYVHGLPTSVTNTDITQFFADTSVLPDKIHIMLSKFGRPTGESYCEFSSVQQAHTALIKDQCYMGPNLVHVSPINRSDMIQAITKPMQQHNNHHQDMSWGPGGGGGNRGGGPRQHNMMSGPRQQHQGPQSSYGGSGGHNGGYGGGRPQPYMNNARGGGYTPRIRGPGPNTGPDGFGQPGCVVALDNVPYCADVQEIVDFFSGFELNSQNVIRRFNDFGKPTGEARVNLRNPQEAMRAVRVLQNKPIFNRPVRLTLL